MARYSEDDDYPEDAPRSSYRRGSEPSTARRETLMQRRLRRARGEDEDYDEDYDDEPHYSRSRRAYPEDARFGGCGMSLLPFVLGIAAIVAVLLLVGRQLIASVTPNVPEQVRQIIATPTSTILDRGGTIQQIRELNRLETQSFSIERVIDARIERGNFLDTFLGDRLLLIASGTVVAGVDLSKLRSSDITISQDGKQITLQLPPSEIFFKTLDNQRTRVYDRQTGLFADQSKDLETQARQAAEQEILQAACEGGIMEKAANEASQSMEQFLKLLDFETIKVETSVGSCIAPATVPTLQTTPP